MGGPGPLNVIGNVRFFGKSPGVFTLLIWWNYVLQDRGANFRAFETIYYKLTKKIRKNYKNSKKFKNFQNIYVKKHHKNEKSNKNAC